MISQLKSSNKTDINYPESDGKPMADNTVQYYWLTTLKSNLDWLFTENDQVFIAGDLLWYPVEGDNKTAQAPDIMIVWGRPKGHRGSYQQWKEENIPPQVVFEILSPSNTLKEMNKKLLFYQNYGVEEYYIYNPQKNDLNGLIRGENNNLEIIETINGWVSPRLGIKFELTESELKLYYPNGQPFSTYVEVQQKVQQAEEKAQQAEEKAKQEQQKAQQAEEKAAKLAAKLKELGINPEEI